MQCIILETFNGRTLSRVPHLDQECLVQFNYIEKKNNPKWQIHVFVFEMHVI